MTDLRDAHALERFIATHGIADADAYEPTYLGGGVSSVVVRVSSGERRVVVKQAMRTLAVQETWHADVARSEVEARCGQLLAELIPGSVPQILSIDAAAHAFVMECAPEGSRIWKDDLLAGRLEPAVASQVGALLGTLHRASTGHATATRFADRRHFDDLRIDPFFRVLQRRHPDLADEIQEAIDAASAPGRCLVHGDASPKNLLVRPDGRVWIIDHEVAHWGEPSFDLAFLLAHLCLKAVFRRGDAERVVELARTALAEYVRTCGEAGADPVATARILGPLLLARVDGTSPVDYLDDPQREGVRQLARGVIRDRTELDDVLDRVITTGRS